MRITAQTEDSILLGSYLAIFSAICVWLVSLVA